MTPGAYCRAKVAMPGGELYYALLFTPRPVRGRWVAALTLATEIIEILDECSDPVPARAKLAWWREELDGAPQAARHPATRALAAAVSRIPLDYFRALVDTVAARVAVPVFDTHAELRTYSDATSGGFARVAAKLCGATDPRTPERAARLGGAIGLADHLLHPYRRRGLARLRLAREDLLRNAVEPRALGARTTPPGLRTLLRERLPESETILCEGVDAIPSSDRAALFPLLAGAAIRRRMIESLRRRDHALLERRPELRAISQLWIAWQAQRQARLRP